MNTRNFCFVDTIARTVTRLAHFSDSDDLLEFFSRTFLETMITNKNIAETTERIDQLRLFLEDKLARMAGLGRDWQDKPAAKKKFQRIVDARPGELASHLESLKRQIRFLTILCDSINQLQAIKAKNKQR